MVRLKVYKPVQGLVQVVYMSCLAFLRIGTKHLRNLSQQSPAIHDIVEERYNTRIENVYVEERRRYDTINNNPPLALKRYDK